MLGLFAWGCAVYDTDLLPADGSLSGTGNTGAEAGEGGEGGMETGGASSSGGKVGTSAGKGSTEAGTSNSAGTATVEGGAPATEEGGAGGDTMSGAGGTAGTTGGGGSAGSAAGTSGSSGSSGGGGGGGGGGGNAVKCSEHPLTDKTTWKASASHESMGNGMESDGLYNPPFHAIDGITSERWSTGKPQSGNEWFEIDFGQEVTVTRVTLQTFNKDVDDYPRMYAVRFTEMSMNFLATPLVSGSGTSGSTVIDLPEPTTGQFLLIRQTGAVEAPDAKWWTIGEVVVTCTD